MTKYEKGLNRLDKHGRDLHDLCCIQIKKIDTRITFDIQKDSIVYKINSTRFCDIHPGSSQPGTNRGKSRSLIIDINTFGQQQRFKHPLGYREKPKPYARVSEYIRYNVSNREEFKALIPLLKKSYKIASNWKLDSKNIFVPKKINQEQRAYFAWEYLTKIATEKKKTSYKDLAKAAGVPHPRPTRFVLDLIQDYCLRNRLPPLTILVVNQSGQPGAGFIAWDIDDLEKGFNHVYKYNWTVLPNPFNYASEGADKEMIIKKLLDFPEKSNEVYSAVRSRGVAQPIFRDAVLRAYDRRCAICSFGIESALDASHIIAWKDCSRKEKMDIRNGIIFCATHHKLFDYGYITINDDYTINYQNSDLKKQNHLESEKVITTAFNGKKIRLPKKTCYYPKVEYLRKHRESFERK